VLLFDGVFLLRAELVSKWDLKIFLDVSFENAGIRCAARDGGAGQIPELTARYVEGQTLYLRLCRPQEAADLLVNHNDLERPSIAARKAGLTPGSQDVQ
jgi:uridine kinase